MQSASSEEKSDLSGCETTNSEKDNDVSLGRYMKENQILSLKEAQSKITADIKVLEELILMLGPEADLPAVRSSHRKMNSLLQKMDLKLTRF